MRISGISSIIGNAAAQSSSGVAAENSGASASSSPDFSNISASNLQDVNVDLYNQGKITLRQSGELALIDGWALRGVNNGQMRTGSLNAYSMIDSIIKYQEESGVGDVKATVASWTGLKEALENYSASNTSDTSTSAPTADSSTTNVLSSSSVDFTNMSRNQLKTWVNEQIKSGNMSFDQGTNLALMTGQVPMSGTSLTDSTDNDPVNLVKIAQDGIAGAIARNDTASLKMLENALTTMEKYQNKTTIAA